MKLLPALILIASLASASAQLVIPSDGSDGAFNPTADIEIDLGLAQTAVWSTPVPGGSTGIGTYDALKWAVVFKYSSVNIPEGVTVTFKNHPSRAPVVWLVGGNVTISGTVSLMGKPARNGLLGLNPTEPGPGGFRGGAVGPAGVGAGLGPGGGGQFDHAAPYETSYGNPQIIPLIGGSGAGSHSSNSTSGAGGGGAILIAAPNEINVNGSILATPGTPLIYQASCGAIKLIASSVTGSGTLDAGSTPYKGRLRIEANSISGGITTFPSTITVPPAVTPVIFQPDNAPTVRIVSVDGVPSPADPTAPLQTGADLTIEKNQAVKVVVETRNFTPAGAVVAVRRANKYGVATNTNATFVSGNTTQALWEVNLVMAPGFSTLQVRATAP